MTADHGDEFGEHGKFGHQTLYDGVVRVPLIITGPGIQGGTLVRQQVSLIDLAPTIGDLVGIDNLGNITVIELKRDIAEPMTGFQAIQYAFYYSDTKYDQAG